MRDRRGLLIANSEQGGSDLPPGYTALNYLQSTGTQYIVLPPMVGDVLVYIRFSYLRRPSYNGDARAIWTGANNSFNVGILRASAGDSVYLAKTSWAQQTMSLLAPTGNIALDTDYTCIVSYKNTGDTWRTQGLFATPTGGAVLCGKIYAFYTVDNVTGERNRDLVPCLDDQNQPCFYDKVNERTHYNQGTGEFSYG